MSGLNDVSHEIWAAAQLSPGEGIADGCDRIIALLAAFHNVALEKLRDEILSMSLGLAIEESRISAWSQAIRDRFDAAVADPKHPTVFAYL